MKRMVPVLAAALVLVSCPNVPQPPGGVVILD
jgi:PBP1b-binding outer membrane lipoprotein LpoB